MSRANRYKKANRYSGSVYKIKNAVTNSATRSHTVLSFSYEFHWPNELLWQIFDWTLTFRIKTGKMNYACLEKYFNFRDLYLGKFTKYHIDAICFFSFNSYTLKRHLLIEKRNLPPHPSYEAFHWGAHPLFNPTPPPGIWRSKWLGYYNGKNHHN